MDNQTWISIVSLVCGCVIGRILGKYFSVPYETKIGTLWSRLKQWWKKNDIKIIPILIVSPFLLSVLFVPIGRFVVGLSWMACSIAVGSSLALVGLLFVVFAIVVLIRDWKNW